ncbi:MAG: hypothetical protein JWN36_374 [Microbacteriaceae bacterium]|jgi:hypothetical protein|nr:hypothetical protein [Microbacteriaceae bacterium]
MDLGPLGSYRLPAAIRSAYGVETAQDLADQLGVTKRPSLTMSGEAEDAYEALKRGDRSPARTLLVEKLGVSEAKADEALAKLPKL